MQSVYSDGSLSLHTRSLKYGKVGMDGHILEKICRRHNGKKEHDQSSTNHDLHRVPNDFLNTSLLHTINLQYLFRHSFFLTYSPFFRIAFPGVVDDCAFYFTNNSTSVVTIYFDIIQARVVQRMDNTIRRINHYPADSVDCFVNTYPLDSDLFGG